MYVFRREKRRRRQWFPPRKMGTKRYLLRSESRRKFRIDVNVAERSVHLAISRGMIDALANPNSDPNSEVEVCPSYEDINARLETPLPRGRLGASSRTLASVILNESFPDSLDWFNNRSQYFIYFASFFLSCCSPRIWGSLAAATLYRRLAS